MSYFQKCGKEVPEGARFCPTCGANVNLVKKHINKKGVGYEAGKSTKTLNRRGLLASSLGVSATAAGAHLIAISQESNFIRWEEIRSITVHRRQRVIYIRRKALINPIALYCAPENFPVVVDLTKRYTPDARIKRNDMEFHCYTMF